MHDAPVDAGDDQPPEGVPDPDLPGDITHALRAVRAREPGAAERLAELVYPELRRIAAAYRRRERPDHSLQPTDLVHEAYVRLMPGSPDLSDRKHLFAAFARAMRQVLVDHARQRGAAKRGGGRERITWRDDAAAARNLAADLNLDVLALHEALERLAKLSPRQARIVELRFFGGLSIPETADTLDLGETQVKADWAMARAWLQAELAGDEEP